MSVALVEEQGDGPIGGHHEGVRMTIEVVVVPEEILRRMDESGYEECAENEVHGEPQRGKERIT